MTTLNPFPSQPQRAGVGQRLSWDLPSELHDPRLGLGDDDLIELFQGVEPEDWSPARAKQLRHATHAVCSHIIGEMSTERSRLAGVKKAMMGVCVTELPDLEGPHPPGTAFEDLLEVREFWRKDPYCGWGTGPAGLRMVFEAGEIAVPSRTRGDQPLKLRHRGDFQTLDAAYNRARRTRSLLPVPLCAAFFPPRRMMAIEGVAEPVVAPSAMEFVAQLIVWGPAETRARLVEYLSVEAEREVSPRVDRPQGGQVADSTLENIASDIGSVTLRIHELSGTCEGLEHWRVKMKPVTIDELDAQVEEWRADRRAVPIQVLRRSRNASRERVEARRDRNGRLQHAQTDLRDMLLLDFTTLGLRIGEVARIAPTDVLDHVCIGSYEGPAIRMYPQKRRGGSNRARTARMRPISRETHRYALEYFEIMGLERDDAALSLWVSRRREENGDPGRLTNGALSARLGGIGSPDSVPLLPRSSGGGYSAHAVRHLAEQLAFSVGAEFLKADPTQQEHVTALVFGDALLNHTMSSDRHGYKGLVANRGLWAMRAVIGVPEKGVSGLIDLIQTDAGARRSYDIEEIVRRCTRITSAEERCADLERELLKERSQLSAVIARELPETPSESEVTLDQAVRLLLALNGEQAVQRREERIRRDAIDLLRDALDVVRREETRARSALDGLRAMGKTHVIPDRELTTAELRASGAQACGLEDETWDQALARARKEAVAVAAATGARALTDDEACVRRCPLCRSEAVDGSEAKVTDTLLPPRVRRHLNMAEFCALVRISDGGTARKWFRGETNPPFPIDGPESPVVVQGARLRFLDVDKLPDYFLMSLLPEQREMLEEMLRIPMGETGWGGRKLKATALERN